MVTIDSLQETTMALSSGTTADPYDPPFPKIEVSNAALESNFAMRAATWRI